LLAETDQANYAQGNPYTNTYNPGLRNHPNFSYKNNNATFAHSFKWQGLTHNGWKYVPRFLVFQ